MILSFTASLLLSLVSLLVIARKRTLSNVAFCAAAFLLAFIEVADRLSMSPSFSAVAVKQLTLFLESLQPATFLLFSLTYSRRAALKSLSPWWRGALACAAAFPASVFLLPPDAFFYAPDFSVEKMLFLGVAGYWFYLGIMLYCIMALVNIESVYSAASWADRKKVKTELLGIVGIIAVLIFYYSQGLLYRTINMNLMPMRSGIFIFSAGLIGYSKLFRDNDTRVVMSRQILYRSLTLFSVGAYLLVLGLIGEGMQYFGSSFGKNVVMFIAFATGISALGVLSSQRIRRKVKVFINKNFYAQKHDYRSEWLQFTGRLASCKSIESVYQRILLTYSETFGLKGVALYLPDREKYSYSLAARQGMEDPATKLKLSPALVAYFMDRNRVMSPDDGEYLPDQEELSFVRRTGASLLVPLIASESIEGVVVFGEQMCREELIFEDYDLMKTIARQAALAVVNFRLSEELAQTREIAAVAKISSFVIHDLKNLAYSLSLLLENTDEYMEEPEFQKDMVETIRNTVTKMKNLIQTLKEVPEKDMLNRAPADISLLVKSTLEELKKLRKNLDVDYHGVSVLSMVDAEEIKKVILNLLINASDALAGNGVIKVETGISSENSYIRVEDRGCGMTDEFVGNHLFKPFRTTKKKGLGIGLYQCKQIVDAHDGRIEVLSKSGEGAVFTVFLPVLTKRPHEFIPAAIPRTPE